MVSVTGSIATGQKVIEAAAPAVRRTHLELGGKAPVIVFDDADVASVVEGIKTFGYYNSGQDCTAACRMYVAKKVYDNLVADLSAAVKSIKYNLPNDEENEIGPLISAAQRERVKGFVERAGEQKHVSVTAGGKEVGGNGFFFEPTVVANALQADEIVRERCSGQSCRSRGSTTSSRLSSGRTIRDYGLCLIGVDDGLSQGHGDGGAAAIRLHLGQHALHAG